MGHQQGKAVEEQIAAAALQCAHKQGLDNITRVAIGELVGKTEGSIETYSYGHVGLINLAVSEAIATRTYPIIALQGILRNAPATEILDGETKRAIWRAAEAEFFQPADD